MSKLFLLLLLISTPFTVFSDETKSIGKILSKEMIGVQRQYLEQFTGPAKYVSKNYLLKKGVSYRGYDISGCSIGVTENKTQAVLSISIPILSKNCTFDTSSVFLSKPAHLLTFGDLAEVGIDLKPRDGCTRNCGQLTPSFGLKIWTPRSMSNIQFEVTVDASSQDAESAANRFAKKLSKQMGVEEFEIGQSLDDAKKIGNKKYISLFIEEFKNVKINSIEFGYQFIN
jgi:hypothetical protein